LEATELRTRSASWPMMAYTSLAGTTLVAAATTCTSRGLPPTSCSTLGCLDLSRVPLPAAILAMAVRGPDDRPSLFALGIQSNIPRDVMLGQLVVTVVTGRPRCRQVPAFVLFCAQLPA